MIPLLREAPPWRGLEMAGQMNEAVKAMILPEPMAVTLLVVDAFERLNVPDAELFDQAI